MRRSTTIGLICWALAAFPVLQGMRSMRQWDYVVYLHPTLGWRSVGTTDGGLDLNWASAHYCQLVESDRGFHLISNGRPGAPARTLLRMPRTISQPETISLNVPCWQVIAILALCGLVAGGLSLPERRLQFTLRGMVIATTLMAATMGMGVVAGRIDLQRPAAAAATP